MANSQKKATSSKKQRTIKIGSFNVRGLMKPEKHSSLVRDHTSYKVDIGCLQETKVSELNDEIIDGYRVILLPSKLSGFIE